MIILVQGEVCDRRSELLLVGGLTGSNVKVLVRVTIV